MSKKQLAYFLMTIYKKYADVNLKNQHNLWDDLLRLSEEDLESKIEEDLFLIIEEFPDMKEKLLTHFHIDQEEVE